MIEPGEYGIRLTRAAARIKPELEAAVVETLERAREIAHDKFGEYQRGWPPLAEETIRRKGFEDPLIRTGETRDSLHVKIDGPARGVLYSTSKALVYSEYGTSNEPPRPLMKESVRQGMREVGIARMRFVLTRALAGGI